MTGRGRPHKTPSPADTRATRKTRKDSSERPNDTTKRQKAKEHKKMSHTEEKPSVQGAQKGKTAKRDTEETRKQSRTPTDTKPHVNGTTCAVRAETPSTEMTPKTKPEAPKSTEAKTCGRETKCGEKPAKDMTKTKTKTKPEAPKSTEAKTCGRETKCGEKPAKDMTKTKTKTKPETPKSTEAKTCGRETKCGEKPAKDMTKTQPQLPEPAKKAAVQGAKPKKKSPEEPVAMQTLQHTTEADVPQDRREDKAAVDSILYKTVGKLKIRRKERSDAAEVINRIIANICKHMKERSESFKEVEEPLPTGSYYENLKISSPDEFDVMLPFPVKRVTIDPFGDDGAFYSVALKRGKSPLKKFQEDSTLSGSKMLQEFRDEVKKSVKGFTEWKMTKKKKGCPAVTLETTVQSTTISLDVVLCLKVDSSWPPFTKYGIKIDGWLGTKVKQDYKQKGYYLVPKYEGRGTEERDGVLTKDTWRVSFSHVEKAMLRYHGSEKTCCERGGDPCCRKDCLKLLKHLLSSLKEEDPSFNSFCSYQAKTTLLHACCSRTKDSLWKASNLGECFRLLLNDFIDHLEQGKLCNFFIPTQNLLSGLGQTKCKSLARRLREECNQGFPIFK